MRVSPACCLRRALKPGARLLLGLALVGALDSQAADKPAISTATLLDDMTNLTAIAEFPAPAYTCKQFSSFDRKSKSPKEEWFANDDYGNFVRVESHEGRQEYVMMDAPGPGAIVRMWSANPAGTIRIYLDGAEQPVIEAPMTDLLGGKYPGLPRPIAGEYSKGWNLYFPITYTRSCKVTSDKGGFYYHVNYRTYEPGTMVDSFKADQITKLASRLEGVVRRLAEPRGNEADLGGDPQEFELQVPAGESVRQQLPGPMAISRATLRLTAKDREAALRGIIVKISFDGEPCIEAPLGDVFGSAPGINPYASLPLGMLRDGLLYCHWFMPFKESAIIELVNHTRQDATVAGEIALKDYGWNDRSMHFHAKWRAEFDVPTRPMLDWNYLAAQGKGVFAGVSFAIDNPVKDWWGEGDEKIYVDGELFPSHFGTGTEDYYGYAWCWPELFTHAYHSQSRCDGPRNYGRTSVNRFHILDRIPFSRSFKFDMELWHWNDKCLVNAAVVAYWYARPGGTDEFKSITAKEAVVRPMPEYKVPKVTDAIEGEKMRIVKVSGTAEPQDWEDLSAGAQLWWHQGMKPGESLTVAFPAPRAGKYHVIAHFLTAKDYGVHQLSINGTKAGDPRDFYSAEVKPTAEIDLGVFDLKAGDNEFSATVMGANDKAVKSYMLGLDYLLLRPAN
jgi:hypothetical protein